MGVFSDAFVIVTGVGECTLAEIDETTAGRPERVCLAVPGEIAWDACECGQFAQSIAQDVPSNVFPTPAEDTRTTPCGPLLRVVTVNVSLMRCVSVLTDDGRAPTCAQQQADALQIEEDRVALRRGVTCCLKDLRTARRITDFSVGAAVTRGPQGMCAGIELTYRFALNSICC